jgi:serine/threonine protein kinase
VLVAADDAAKGTVKAGAETEGLIKSFVKELEVGHRVRHANIVRLFGVVVDEHGLCGMVMQLCSLGSIREFVKRMGGRLREEVMFVFAFEVASALQALHETGGMVHCDMKGANVLVTPFTDGEGRDLCAVKLCDFGVSEPTRTGTAGAAPTIAGAVPGTARYLSPEVLAEEDEAEGGAEGGSSSGGGRGRWRQHRARDVYGYGHFLYEMATGRAIFEGMDDAKVTYRIGAKGMKPEFQPKDNAPEWLTRLAQLCWESDPVQRMAHFGGVDANRPMAHVLEWLKRANLPLAREAMRQMLSFAFFEIRHPFLDSAAAAPKKKK